MRLAVGLAIVTSVLLSGCARGPLQVGGIQVGKGLNDDRSISTPATLFKPRDTVYVSVLTSDTGKGTLTVKWIYNGRVVAEPSKPVSYQGAAYTEFHMQSAGGFPVGDYRVEVLVDGQPAGSRTFKVGEE